MKQFEYNGQTRSIAEWASKVGISRAAMSKRLKKAESPEAVEKALTAQPSQGKRNDRADNPAD